MAAKLGMTNAELIDSINSDLGNVVTLNGNQTISGQKVFTTQLLRNSTDIDVTSKATSITYNTAVRFFDKNGKDIGAVNNAQMNGGIIRTMLEARNKNNYIPSIGVQAPYEGSTGGFGYAPNTPDNAPAYAIVTTSWFNQKMQVVSALPAAPDANVFYFIPE